MSENQENAEQGQDLSQEELAEQGLLAGMVRTHMMKQSG